MKISINALRQRELREKLWPEITEDHLWQRKNSKGFTPGFATVPRTMPLIMSIIDDLTKNKPASATLLELFCRDRDGGCVVSLASGKEIAFHSGLIGQRGERTWRERLKALDALGFVKLKSGPSGPMSYALILNPYHVIKKLYNDGNPGVTADKYNALVARATEIGAKDLDYEEQKQTIVKQAKAATDSKKKKKVDK